jgi:hypothetical protein
MLELIDLRNEAYINMDIPGEPAPRLRYYASDIIDELACETQEQAKEAMDRALHACLALNLDLSHHFRPVYRYNGEMIKLDWQLSSIGCYLLVVNADPCNPLVAKAQLYLFSQH